MSNDKFDWSNRPWADLKVGGAFLGAAGMAAFLGGNPLDRPFDGYCRDALLTCVGRPAVIGVGEPDIGEGRRGGNGIPFGNALTTATSGTSIMSITLPPQP